MRACPQNETLVKNVLRRVNRPITGGLSSTIVVSIPHYERTFKKSFWQIIQKDARYTSTTNKIYEIGKTRGCETQPRIGRTRLKHVWSR